MSKAPTKKVTFSDETLELLRGLEWSEDGLLAKITEKLDRPVYNELNKALELMGGKWNRGKGGHVFEKDPRSDIEGLIENEGEIVVVKEGFFETPEKLVLLMIKEADIKDGHTLLEPSAGKGAIVKKVRELFKGVKISCIEKNKDRYMYLRKLGFVVLNVDFSEFETRKKFDRVLLNPPFENGQDIDHVLHAYTMLKEDGVLVAIMSESAFIGNLNRVKIFKQWLKFVDAQVERLPKGTFKESGTMANTRMVVIRRTKQIPHENTVTRSEGE